MTPRQAAGAALVALLLVGCRSRSSAPPEAAAGSSSAAPSASATEADGKSAPTRWAGSYTSGPGSLYVPDGGEWSGVKWRGDDASDGLGPGTMSLTIDPASKRVEGSIDGSLGAARVVGVYSNGAVTATLVRTNPTDRGFTGTLVGEVPADKPSALSGTMRLSLGDGRLVREASFTLAKSP